MTTRPNLDRLLERLRAVQSDAPRVISCYLRLDPPARQGHRYLQELKARSQELEHWVEDADLPHGVREEVRADLAELAAWLSEPRNLPHAPGLALFVCRRQRLFEPVPLGRVHRTRIDVDRAPLLQELLGAREAFGRYLAVLLDRRHARLFDVGAFDALELPGLAPIGRRGGKFAADRGDAPGWGERDYHQRVETEKHRHYAAIARELTRLAAATPFRGIALLGPEEHTRALRHFLPRAIAGIVMGESPLNPTAAAEAEVHSAVWEQQRDQERAQERAQLEAVETGTATGFAVNGPRETLRALSRGQVRVLLVPVTQRGAGFRCADTGRLVLSQAECRGEGIPAPVPCLVDRAIDQALGQGAEVVVVDDPEVAGAIDGLAAMLRFRLEAAAGPVAARPRRARPSRRRAAV